MSQRVGIIRRGRSPQGKFGKMPYSLDPSRTVECAQEPVRAAALTVVVGGAVGRRYRLGEETTIGRSLGCNIVVDDAEASRRHAKVSLSGGGGLLLEDQGSRNGTFVNGVRISRRLLAFGDKIGIGSRFVLRLDPHDPETEEIADRQRFETIGRMGLGMAHDLGNVISSLLAGIAYLNELGPDCPLGEAEPAACLADLAAAAQRASEMVGGMLSLARGRPGERSPVDVSQLAVAVARMLRYTLGTSITILSRIDPGWHVLASRSELHQILLNLCLNARDAMPKGGTLRIEVSLVPSVPASLAWPSGKPAVRIIVADTGCGMDADTSRRIFEPFFTTKRENAGYGLGLATVRELVTQHGGAITLETAPGRGATFFVYFPLHDVVAASPLMTTGEHPPALGTNELSRRLRILLVDDETILRRSVSRLLKRASCDVDEASCGLDAVRAYVSGRYDLVLLDSHMPDMTGLETQARIVELDPAARIAFASGQLEPELEAQGRARGAIGFLQKPYTSAQVVDLAMAPHHPRAPADSDPPTRVDISVR